MDGQAVVVALPAEIDVTNSDEVLATLTRSLTPGVSVVIADMTATVFCDTSGVRALVTAHQDAAARDAELRFAIPEGESVRRVLELTGIIRVLPVYASLDEARWGS